jgi:hypothetical protein
MRILPGSPELGVDLSEASCFVVAGDRLGFLRPRAAEGGQTVTVGTFRNEVIQPPSREAEPGELAKLHSPTDGRGWFPQRARD